MTLEALHREFPLDAQPLQCEGLTIDKIPCCWIVTRESDGKKVKLNDSSMLIWQLCEEENTVGDIIDALAEAFPDVENIDRDIHRALDELLDEELITLS